VKIKEVDAFMQKCGDCIQGCKLLREQGFFFSFHIIVESNFKLLVDMVAGSCKLNGNTLTL